MFLHAVKRPCILAATHPPDPAGPAPLSHRARAPLRGAAADADCIPRMTDRFQQTIDEIAERREAAREALRRMREAIERSRQLLRESGEELKPPNGDRVGTGAPGGESGENQG